MIPPIPKGHEPTTPTLGQYPPDGTRYNYKDDSRPGWHPWPLDTTCTIDQNHLDEYHFCAPADVERLLAERDALRAEAAIYKEGLYLLRLDIHNQRTGWGNTQFLRMADDHITVALAATAGQGGQK